MAALEEIETYEGEIYQIETTDPVMGGSGGITNVPLKQLANRTKWLKAKVDAIIGTAFEAAKAIKLSTARKISLGGLLTGNANFDGSSDITINASMADGALSIAKTSGLQAALDGKIGSVANASTTAAGIIEIATTAETGTGTDTERAITPSGLYNALLALATKAGFSVSLGSNGYIKLPSWLGGVILQWGDTGAVTASSTTTVTFPMAFTTTHLIAVASIDYSSTNNNYQAKPRKSSLSKMTILCGNGAADHIYWFSVGY